jgi:hypothetical protein
MTNNKTLSGLFLILLALGFLLVGCTSLDRDTQAAKLNIDSFVSKTYENATTSYDNNDFLTAIHQYREVLRIRPNHSDSKTYLKLAWDKLLEENKNLYPSPFEGQYAFSREAIVVPSHVIARSNPSYKLKEGYYIYDYYDSYGNRTPYKIPYSYLEEKEVPYYETVPEYTIPAANFLYIFKDKTYTFIANDGAFLDYFIAKFGAQEVESLYKIIQIKGYDVRTQKEGTFYYNGNNLELDDGTILIHSDNVLRDQQNREFTRKQEYTDNEK